MKQRTYSTAEGRQALATGRFPGDLKLPDRPKVKRESPEGDLGRSVADAVKAAGIFGFHIANERGNEIERMMLAALGVMPGVADWCFPIANGALWIELKAGKNKQTVAQREFERAVDRLPGHYYFVARSVEEFFETLVWHRVPGSERIRL